jgi:large subunit ribosomal protein L9
MKVVLREHVEHLGDRGDVVAVAAGFARNYLIPKRLAVEATPGNLKVVAQERRMWAVKEARDVSGAADLARKIEATEIEIVRKAGETGTLYGSVTNSDVAEALAARGVEIDRRRIVLTDPIKAIGSYELAVRLHHSVQGKIKLRVVGDRPEDAAATKE